jgi:hypothetical protein
MLKEQHTQKRASIYAPIGFRTAVTLPLKHENKLAEELILTVKFQSRCAGQLPGIIYCEFAPRAYTEVASIRT